MVCISLICGFLLEENGWREGGGLARPQTLICIHLHTFACSSTLDGWEIGKRGLFLLLLLLFLLLLTRLVPLIWRRTHRFPLDRVSMQRDNESIPNRLKALNNLKNESLH